MDVEAIVEASGEGFDAAYVEQWLVECVGSDDGRIATWQALMAASGKHG